jgi:23S rRNA (guanosine2251-2'-O)-methyltransferase
METSLSNSIGHQLSSEELHQRQQEQHIERVAPSVIVAGVADPINVGTIFRICDAVKCKQIVFVDAGDIDIQKVKRASRSTNTVVPFEFVASKQFAHSVDDFTPLVAIEITSQSSDVYRTQLPADGAFVIGSERHGIPEHILRLCTYAVHIPMFGVNSSMNVATSLGIVLYEWHRRFRA